jgi:monoamine oxidase
MNIPKVIVIGAGLNGLTCGYLLQKKGIHVTLLEANTRIGGRIETRNGTTNATIEMGATWFSKLHPHLFQLLDELELSYFKQHTQGISLFETMSFVPPQKFEISEFEEPSFRIKGGTQKLIEKLAEKIGWHNIKTETKVITINEVGNQMEVLDLNGTVHVADCIITTLPPNLMVNTIKFSPVLPENIVNLAKETHTWMGESIKFAVEYTTPFWKENNYSGTLFSQASIITEMYDHSTFDNTGYALKGFLNGATSQLSVEERKTKVIAQLKKLFGSDAENFVAYYEKVWRDEPLTFCYYDHLVMAHQNNGHQLYQNSFLNNKLYISGSETATQHPGYMEGAIVAAKNIASQFS